MAKLPTISEMAQEVARRAVDECEYEGKTLREWIEIIKAQHGTNLAEVGTDLISRAATQTELQLSARRYTVAHEAHGEGQVVWSESLISVSDAMDTLRKIPSAQPKKGKWISLDDFRGKYNENGYKCSECDEHSDYKENFCPNCGAKMEVTT